MTIQSKIWDILKQYGVITLASILYALSFCWFYQPNAISVGGFTGVAQIIYHSFPAIPIGVMTIVLNVPLFIAGTKKQGLKLLISSLYAMTLGSLLIDIVSRIHTFSPMDDLLLAGVFGGLLTGIAVGMELKVGATTGGTELAAKLLKYKFHHISVGKLCLAVDIIVVLAYAFVFRQINNALYGIASMYVFSLAVDFVIYGGTHAKMAYIISEEIEPIKEKLLAMNLGVTMVNGEGGWNGNDKQLALCAFRPQQIAQIKALVTEIDPKAFIIVCDVHEVLGEGFGSYSPDEL